MRSPSPLPMQRRPAEARCAATTQIKGRRSSLRLSGQREPAAHRRPQWLLVHANNCATFSAARVAQPQSPVVAVLVAGPAGCLQGLPSIWSSGSRCSVSPAGRRRPRWRTVPVSLPGPCGRRTRRRQQRGEPVGAPGLGGAEPLQQPPVPGRPATRAAIRPSAHRRSSPPRPARGGAGRAAAHQQRQEEQLGDHQQRCHACRPLAGHAAGSTAPARRTATGSGCRPAARSACNWPAAPTPPPAGCAGRAASSQQPAASSDRRQRQHQPTGCAAAWPSRASGTSSQPTATG